MFKFIDVWAPLGVACAPAVAISVIGYNSQLHRQTERRIRRSVKSHPPDYAFMNFGTQYFRTLSIDDRRVQTTGLIPIVCTKAGPWMVQTPQPGDTPLPLFPFATF